MGDPCLVVPVRWCDAAVSTVCLSARAAVEHRRTRACACTHTARVHVHVHVHTCEYVHVCSVQYALHAEVFSLNSLLAALLLLQVVIFATSSSKGSVYAGAFLCGLGLTNQHTLIFFIIPIVSGLHVACVLHACIYVACMLHVCCM